METLKFFAGALLFVVIYGFVDWFAGVTAPVLGPIVLLGLIVSLFWAMVRIWKWGQK